MEPSNRGVDVGEALLVQLVLVVGQKEVVPAVVAVRPDRRTSDDEAAAEESS